MFTYSLCVILGTPCNKCHVTYRQWDPAKARTMYLKMAAWRTENDVETLYKTFDFPELDAVVPFYSHFYHKVGRCFSMPSTPLIWRGDLLLHDDGSLLQSAL